MVLFLFRRRCCCCCCGCCLCSDDSVTTSLSRWLTHAHRSTGESRAGESAASRCHAELGGAADSLAQALLRAARSARTVALCAGARKGRRLLLRTCLPASAQQLCCRKSGAFATVAQPSWLQRCSALLSATTIVVCEASERVSQN